MSAATPTVRLIQSPALGGARRLLVPLRAPRPAAGEDPAEFGGVSSAFRQNGPGQGLVRATRPGPSSSTDEYRTNRDDHLIMETWQRDDSPPVPKRSALLGGGWSVASCAAGWAQLARVEPAARGPSAGEQHFSEVQPDRRSARRPVRDGAGVSGRRRSDRHPRRAGALRRWGSPPPRTRVSAASRGRWSSGSAISPRPLWSPPESPPPGGGPSERWTLSVSGATGHVLVTPIDEVSEQKGR
jgi:hypothetical protein